MKKNIQNAAFTLIELLVVIAIIAILMAVMTPALQRARQQALSTVCASRQRDTGFAFNLYAQDWDGALPRAYWGGEEGTEYTRLPYKLAPYYDQKKWGASNTELFGFKIYSCPAQPKWLPNSAGKIFDRDKSDIGSYGYNKFYFYGLDPGRGTPLRDWIERNIVDMRDSANLPLYGCLSGEEYMGLGAGGGQIMGTDGPHPKALKYGFLGGEVNALTRARTDRWGLAPNHGKNANILMGDFSLRAVDVTVDGQFPWVDYRGTMFHPSRASSRGYQIR